MTKREFLADAILVLTAFIWGTGFVVMKNTLDALPPGAIIAIRYAIAIGGDSDTIGAIVGAIAEALWGIPEQIKQLALTYLPTDIMDIYTHFVEKTTKK